MDTQMDTKRGSDKLKTTWAWYTWQWYITKVILYPVMLPMMYYDSIHVFLTIWELLIILLCVLIITCATWHGESGTGEPLNQGLQVIWLSWWKACCQTGSWLIFVSLVLLEIIRWEKGCLFWTFPLICGRWRKIKLSTCTIFQRIPATFGLFSLEVGYQEGRHFLCSPWTSRSRSKRRPLRSMIDFLNGKDLSGWLLQIATWTDSTLDRLWSSLTRPCVNNHQLDDYCWKGAIEEVLFIYI